MLRFPPPPPPSFLSLKLKERETAAFLGCAARVTFRSSFMPCLSFSLVQTFGRLSVSPDRKHGVLYSLGKYAQSQQPAAPCNDSPRSPFLSWLLAKSPGLRVWRKTTKISSVPPKVVSLRFLLLYTLPATPGCTIKMSAVKTTIKTDMCSFSEYRIYPGRGQRFVAKDGKVHTFIHRKEASLFRQKIKPVKLHWTLVWRRMNKKGGKDAVNKRRSRKATKTVQKAIVGLSLEDIKRTRAQKPETKAKSATAVKDAKEKSKKSKAAGVRPQSGPAQKVQIPKQQKQATRGRK
ncbi:ribosomal protein RPL24 [Toxoplasma gondii RUB]|uniref:Ribosomal protein RPL24 n=2 Tax=Toxoplasma gondii TaxID=5811 RepID=A0A086LUJ8_TOXGO|nr:ribosomal protein RPL24 [Toxoplasma gondii RUB]KFH14091.1 ribosomal protein RPL24 [Toxoplasma gondii MAS]